MAEAHRLGNELFKKKEYPGAIKAYILAGAAPEPRRRGLAHLLRQPFSVPREARRVESGAERRHPVRHQETQVRKGMEPQGVGRVPLGEPPARDGKLREGLGHRSR